MNLVVHKAKHPQLYDYIHVAVNGLLPFLTKVCGCFSVSIINLHLKLLRLIDFLLI